METAIAQPAHFVERRRAGSRPPRGTVFVERRRPMAIPLVDVEDLHDADLDAVLADELADRFDAVVTARALAQLVGESGPVAMLAHDLGL
jgi:hypothetical protein